MAAPRPGTRLPGFWLPDPERGREVRGTEPGHPDGGQEVPVSLTTAPGRSPSSGPGEGRARRDPRAGTAAARGAPPGLSGLGPHPGARAYRVSALQVTLLVAKGRDVDLHGCARRPADTEQGRLSALGRRAAPPRPAAPPLSPAPAGPEAARRGPRSAAIPPPARSGRADAAPGDGSGGAGLRAPGFQAYGLRSPAGPGGGGAWDLRVCRAGCAHLRAGAWLGRGRSLPFGGRWVCRLGNITLNRLQDGEERKGMGLLPFVPVG